MAKVTHLEVLPKADPFLYFSGCRKRRVAPGARVTATQAEVTCKVCILALARKFRWDVLTDAQRAILHREVK